MKTMLQRVLIYASVLLLFPFPMVSIAKSKYVDDRVHSYQKAKVTEVIDGDTIKVDIDDQTYKVRFILVDTPETGHPNKTVEKYGKKAADFTRKKLKGKTVYLEKDVSKTDQYGRLLRYVWLKKPSHPLTKSDLYKYCFNSILLEKGYANLATFPPDVAYVKYFKTRVKKAKKNKAGLYSEPKKKSRKGKNPLKKVAKK